MESLCVQLGLEEIRCAIIPSLAIGCEVLPWATIDCEVVPNELVYEGSWVWKRQGHAWDGKGCLLINSFSPAWELFKISTSLSNQSLLLPARSSQSTAYPPPRTNVIPPSFDSNKSLIYGGSTLGLSLINSPNCQKYGQNYLWYVDSPSINPCQWLLSLWLYNNHMTHDT
jgi:hypothetical protein